MKKIASVIFCLIVVSSICAVDMDKPDRAAEDPWSPEALLLKLEDKLKNIPEMNIDSQNKLINQMNDVRAHLGMKPITEEHLRELVTRSKERAELKRKR